MMKKWKTEEWQVKALFVLMLGVLAVVLLPLFVIAHYNFISVDDYTFAKNAMLVWNETHSVFKVLVAQIAYAKECYFTWQGTYFSEWFVTSLIGIFGRDAYYVGTYLSLGGLVLAEGAGIMVFLTKGMGADKYRAGVITAGCLCMQVLLTPVPVEAFYWFCGAVMYTFSHALAWLLVTALFFFYNKREAAKWKVILLEGVILLLCVAVGGGNYITALTVLILHVLYVIWMFWKKHPRKIPALCNAVFFLAAFLLNVAAPGNLARQQSSGVERISAVGSILLSLKEAAEYLLVNTIPPCVILGILFIPLFTHIVRRRNYKYPWPVLVSIISFGVFAAQFTPTLYALQITGAGRIQNLYRFNFYILLYGNELYWIGWLLRRFREKWNVDSKKKDGQTSYLLPGWMAGGLILCTSLYIWGGSTLTTLSAINDLRTGVAKQYSMEHCERLTVLEDDSLKEVYLKPLSVTPYLLFFGDVTEDTEDWVNQSMADYFEKDKIGLQQ